MRDLQKDLELCKKATPGPWEREQKNGWWKLPEDVNGKQRNTHNHGRILVKEKPFGDVISTLRRYGGQDEDAEFIAQAREGWPHAIERALKAETLNRELAEVLKGYERWEADLIMTGDAWENSLPEFTQELYDGWLVLQRERNYVVSKVREEVE